MLSVAENTLAGCTPKDEAKVQVGDIFREYGPAYRQRHRPPVHHQKVMRDIENCRTGYFGGIVEKCDNCGCERTSYYSCCNRHCPTCQTFEKEKWLESRRLELLPVGYFHTVVTVPHELNPIILWNKKVVYNLFFKAVSETLKAFSKDPKHLGGKAGFLMLLHTWDQLLKFHVHLHIIIPAGALSFEKDRWIHSKYEDFLFPDAAVSHTFRGKFMAFIKTAIVEGKIKFPEPIKNLGTQAGFNKMEKPLWKKDWVVSSQEPFAGPQKVMDYLGRYTHRVAISNNRILSMEDAMVTFKYRNRKKGDIEETETLPAEEFIRRFLLHILPSGFMRIRSYGFLANCTKKKSLALCRELLGVPPPSEIPEKPKETSLELIERLLGVDLTKCPQCKEGKMQFVREIPSPFNFRRIKHESKTPIKDSS